MGSGALFGQIWHFLTVHDVKAGHILDMYRKHKETAGIMRCYTDYGIWTDGPINRGSPLDGIPCLRRPNKKVTVYTGKDRRLGCGHMADVACTQTGAWTRQPRTARCTCPEGHNTAWCVLHPPALHSVQR